MKKPGLGRGLDALLPDLVEQRCVSVRKERGTELYELRK